LHLVRCVFVEPLLVYSPPAQTSHKPSRGPHTPRVIGVCFDRPVSSRSNAMTTRTFTRRRSQRPVKPRRALTEAEREKLRRRLFEWRDVTRGVLVGMAGIATEMLEELSDHDSHLDEFVCRASDLREFLENIWDADCTLTNMLVCEPLTSAIAIPNGAICSTTTTRSEQSHKRAHSGPAKTTSLEICP
jgi:hypothetical protein